jgi:hypothetical protein
MSTPLPRRTPGAALVGPLPSVRFRDGSRVVYSPPTDTMDARYKACIHHRVACDCREAEYVETISELRYEMRATQAAFAEILKGHQTWAYTESGEDEFAQCQCTGCQIVRLADTGMRSASQVGFEREAAGLPWSIGGEK